MDARAAQLAAAADGRAAGTTARTPVSRTAFGPRRAAGLLLLAAAVACLAGCAATTGTIRGRLAMRPTPATARTTSGSPPAAGSAGAEPQRVTDAVVYLEPRSPARRPAPAAHLMGPPAPPTATIVENPHAFHPSVLPIAAGTRVRFLNHDRVYHDVFSRSAPKPFDAGSHGPGQSRWVTFDRPGVVRLFCEIDPAMLGYVIVVPTTWFTQPDSLGAFEVQGLPRGTYALHVWHPTLGRLDRIVELKGSELSVPLHY